MDGHSAGHRILVAAIADFPDGAAVRLAAEETGTGDAVAVFNDGGRFFALNDTCTHAAASLSEGWVGEGQVECPLHGGVFCLRTGAALGLPASTDTVAHAVEVYAGQVWLVPAVG